MKAYDNFGMLLGVAFFYLALSRARSDDVDCKKKLQDVGIIPNYADNTTTADVKIIYQEKQEVICGNEFSILTPSKEPQVWYDADGQCQNLTIMMFNPDMPLMSKSFLSWLVVNVPSEVMQAGYSKGDPGFESADYWAPIFMTGNQRNTICVYCQEKYIKPSRVMNSMFQRYNVDPKAIADANNLGNPMACNFFYVSFGTGLEKYSPFKEMAELNKKLFNKDKKQ